MEPLAGAMLLDRLDVELAITRLDADVCHAVIDHSLFFVNRVVNASMKAPEALLRRIGENPGADAGFKRLVVLLTQLGDFDSMEYAQALVPALPSLEQAGIRPLAIAIGDQAGADRFCTFTGFPSDLLQIEPDDQLHQALGLSAGLQAPGGPWPSLLLMCAGIGSPGTLMEVLRGYTGDRSAPQRFGDDEVVTTGVLPSFPASLFRRAGERVSSVRSNWPRCACAT